MRQLNDLSRSLAAFDQDTTLIAVIELSQASWLIAGIVPGIKRHPLKKLAADEDALLRLLQRWRDEAVRSGCRIERITVAFRLAAMAFGWPAGFGRTTLRDMSFTRRVLPCRASADGRRPTVWIPSS
jgi:hypothetical protein